MVQNYHKAMERDVKLNDLEERSENLLKASVKFHKTSKTLERQKRMKNLKLKIILGVIVALVLVAVIIVIAVMASRGGSGTAPVERTLSAVTTSLPVKETTEAT
ncbi:vesicle-associated membrane protein 5 [Latimeria chalumnae]